MRGTGGARWWSVAALGLLAALGCGPGPSEAYVIDTSPLDDLAASPYTGWTRAHYEAVFGRLCVGFVAHRSPGGGRVVLPNPGGWAEVEGVSRMMFALGAWLADPNNPAVIEVDVTELKVGETIKIGELKPIAGVDYLDTKGQPVVSCVEPVAEIVQEVVAAAVPAEGAAAAPADGAAAAAPGAAGAATPAAGAAAAPAAGDKKAAAPAAGDKKAAAPAPAAKK